MPKLVPENPSGVGFSFKCFTVEGAILDRVLTVRGCGEGDAEERVQNEVDRRQAHRGRGQGRSAEGAGEAEEGLDRPPHAKPPRQTRPCNHLVNLGARDKPTT